MDETMAAQMNTVLALLRRLPPRERLQVIAQALPETERDLDSSLPSSTSGEWDEAILAAAETIWKQELVESGLLAKTPKPLSPSERRLPEPITVPGTPLSELIIAERR
ncbi:MAG: hypothetical protein WHX52_08565 [Anaerolineae bacterium]